MGLLGAYSAGCDAYSCYISKTPGHPNGEEYVALMNSRVLLHKFLRHLRHAINVLLFFDTQILIYYGYMSMFF